MTTTSSLPAEILKLAQTVDVEPSELVFLADVPAHDLATLRGQIADTLFRADRHFFVRIATLAGSIPIPIAARLCETLLTPLLTARTAEVMDPARAAEVVNKMSDRYVADVAAALDPARAPEVVALIPPEKIAALAVELARRGEWVTMGGFASHVSESSLETTYEGFDGAQVLHVTFVMDDLNRIDTIVTGLRDDQVDGIVTAAPEQGLWREFAALLDHLEPSRLARVGARYALAGADVHAAYDAAVAAGTLRGATLERLRA